MIAKQSLQIKWNCCFNGREERGEKHEQINYTETLNTLQINWQKCSLFLINKNISGIDYSV